MSKARGLKARGTANEADLLLGDVQIYTGEVSPQGYDFPATLTAGARYIRAGAGAGSSGFYTYDGETWTEVGSGGGGSVLTQNDPGNGGTIQGSGSQIVITSAGPETRFVAAPTAAGREFIIYAASVGGTITMQFADNVWALSDTVYFSADNQTLRVFSIEVAADVFSWKIDGFSAGVNLLTNPG